MERDNKNRNLNGGFEQEGWSDRDSENYGEQELRRNFQTRNDYRNNKERSHTFENDRSEDYQENEYDREHDYYDSFRRDQGNTSDNRQGYGNSDFSSSSDRYNTLNNSRQDRNANEEHYPRREGGRTPGFGGSMGESSVHSDRGAPHYGTRHATKGLTSKWSSNRSGTGDSGRKDTNAGASPDNSPSHY